MVRTVKDCGISARIPHFLMVKLTALRMIMEFNKYVHERADAMVKETSSEYDTRAHIFGSFI